jgi:hypothetical protein
VNPEAGKHLVSFDHRQCTRFLHTLGKQTEDMLDTDIIGLFASSIILIGVAVGWAHYLEKNTGYPPIMRISVLTRKRGRIAVMLFIVVSAIT